MSGALSPQTIAQITAIENIIGSDPGDRRGIMPLVEAARGGLLGAATSLHQHPRPDIRIITGFYLAHGEPPACETDGPPGAVHLAAGLQRAGIPVRIVTDVPNISAVRAAADAILSADFPIDVVAVAGFDGGEKLSQLSSRWHSQPPSHVIAIERCGPSADGVPRNSKGADMTPHDAPLHEIYSAGKWTRIAIGDGGNEIGMGSLPAGLVAQHIPDGHRIASTVPCDHLIVSGVSNWGAAALLAAFALARPSAAADLTASLTPEIDTRILDRMVTNGPAVAIKEWGGTAPPRPTPAVDGLSAQHHTDILSQIMAETINKDHAS